MHEIENLLARYLRLPSDQEYSDPAINWEEHEALRAFKTVLSNLVIEETLMTRHYGPSRLSYDQFLYNLSLALDNTNFRRKNIYQDAITQSTSAQVGEDAVHELLGKLADDAGLELSKELNQATPATAEPEPATANEPSAEEEDKLQQRLRALRA